MPNSIQKHPEIVKLETDAEILRGELVKLLTEYDNMVTTIGPNLEAVYLLKIGQLQYELFCAETNLRRIKRKIEIYQRALNHGEAVAANIVEAALNEEFDQWQREAENKYLAIKMAQQKLTSLLSEDESREIKKLYRILALRLHPDVNPNQIDKNMNLWMQVVRAYKCGDLEELRALSIMVDCIPEEIKESSSIEIITKKKERFAKQIDEVLAKTVDLKKIFPYNLQEDLGNSCWIEQEQKKIRKEIESFEVNIKQLQQILEEVEGKVSYE